MTAPNVVIQRLKKKIGRLQQQRDHWKAEYNKLSQVLEKFPHLERRYKNLMDWQAEAKEKRALEDRVKEQALLIRLLQSPQDQNGKPK